MNELLTRGIERIFPSKEELEKTLASGKKLKIYFGIDPTGPTLHVGHAVNLLKLKEFQDQGHEITILIGDFTAMIGDPTDKTAARVPLTKEQVAENLKSYEGQIKKILDPAKTIFKFNSDWLSKLSFTELLDLTSRVTFAQIIKRDMFQTRLAENKDLFLHEFLYPVMQGYDSVALDADLEIGGNDQMFNMLVGRDLMKSLKQKEKFVITSKLLVDPTGKKMGKTEGNMASLDDAPNEMYGKVMSWPDSLLPLAFEICTRLPLDEANVFLFASDPKTAKMKLAREIVRLYHDDGAAQAAEENFVSTFSKKEIPEEMEELTISNEDNLADVLVAGGVVKSKSDFRRLLDEGAVTDLDGDTKLTDPNFEITKPTRLRVGKKRFVKIVPR